MYMFEIYACIPQLAAETHVQIKKYNVVRSAMRKDRQVSDYPSK